jgi:hypothetical protein
MGSGSTGQKPIKFDFFEEMEEHFGRHPAVAPIHIASSSTTQMMDPVEIIEIDEEPPSTSSKFFFTFDTPDNMLVIF